MENLEFVRVVGPLAIDFARQEVRRDGKRISLTRSEFKILALLAQEPGRVFTRAQIMQHLWASEYGAAVHVCEVHVSNLRRKLERDPRRPELIQTIRRGGYVLATS